MGATVQVALDSTATPVLEVVVKLRNSTTATFHLPTGPECPLAVQLVRDSLEQRVVGTLAVHCQDTAPGIEMAPHDSQTLVQTYPADSLARLAPGNYSVNVQVTTSTYITTAWAGFATLPLVSPQSSRFARVVTGPNRAP